MLNSYLSEKKKKKMLLKLGLQNCVQLKLIVFQALGLDFPDKRKVSSKASFTAAVGWSI